MRTIPTVLLLLCFVYAVQMVIYRLQCMSFAWFRISLNGFFDSGPVLESLMSATAIGCTQSCLSNPTCKSVNFKEADGSCHLIERGIRTSSQFLIKKAQWTYMTTGDADEEACSQCEYHNLCKEETCPDICDANGSCACEKSCDGTNCQDKMKDCNSIYLSGSNQDGVYNICFNHSTHCFDVFCDMTTNNQGWIVIQRRVNNSVDFYRDWQAYKEGFGNIRGNFWIGLDKLHMLAGPGKNATLRVDLRHISAPNITYYAEYTTFEVGNEANRYKLVIGGYSGDAGDSMGYHNGMKFSTYDKENDLHPSDNCAQRWRGAWWYYRCARANLNAVYPNGTANDAMYMSWLKLNGSYGGIIYSQMKIKY